MKNNFKVPALKIPFLKLMFFMVILIPVMAYYFLSTFGMSGLPSILTLIIIWLMPLFLVVKYFQTKNDDLIINNDKLTLTMNVQKIDFAWEEIEKIGFQGISAKRMGLLETIPYLAIKLKDYSKIETLKSSPEFGFIQKRIDLSLYMNQEDVLDLYLSMRFASEKDYDLLDFLSTKSSFIKKINPLVKTNEKKVYDDILSKNFD